MGQAGGTRINALFLISKAFYEIMATLVTTNVKYKFYWFIFTEYLYNFLYNLNLLFCQKEIFINRVGTTIILVLDFFTHRPLRPALPYMRGTY